MRSEGAIKRANLCIQLIDAAQGVTMQDKKIAGYAHDAGKAVVLAVNKWDLIEKDDNTIERYREEVMTKKFGQDLHRVLRNREDRLFGIVNGIDYKAFNPMNDPGLFKNYNYQKIHRKKLNKKYLQKKLGLPVDMDVPVICATSRVAYQKGFELISNILDQLARLDLQIIIMGDGDKGYIDKLKKYQRKFPNNIIWLPFSENQKIETLVYAGSDFFLLPSHHEPCGINQLIAMRYGCIPIVRKVGGLNDTVENFDPTYSMKKGTGFTFSRFNEFSLYAAIIRALETFKYKDVFRSLKARAMQESNSWDIPAKKYVKLYRIAMKINGKKNINKNI
jgi:starch synthase